MRADWLENMTPEEMDKKVQLYYKKYGLNPGNCLKVCWQCGSVFQCSMDSAQEVCDKCFAQNSRETDDRICTRCGKHFCPTKQNQLRCDECNKNRYTKMVYKYINCWDCGKQVKIPSKNNQTIRCLECQKIADREVKRDWKRKHDAKLKKSRTNK